MILVTGATGLVGSHLLVHLLQENSAVKALYRTKKNIEKVQNIFAFYNQSALFDKINWVQGDITDIPSLELAFDAVTYVYHCAALISFDPKDELKLRKTNIEGTANVVNCCLAFGVKKLCYVSSIAALGNPKEHENVITEETEWNPEKYHSDYAITKYGAEMEVFRGFNEGLPVVIVNPGVIFGYGFPKTGSDAIIQSVKKGLLFYTNGNVGIISVEDVVKTMILLINGNFAGERYILVAENCSIKNLLFYLASISNVKAPTFYASKTMIHFAWKLDWLLSKLIARKRKLTKATALAMHDTTIYNNEKISKTLKINFQKKEVYLQNIIDAQPHHSS